jgi:hypothetical protein
MQYWDDKYGFNDGGSIPCDADLARRVYVQALNALAERNCSQVRAIAWNRPGLHNRCLILVVPLAFFQTPTPSQVLAEERVKLPDEQEPTDDGWEAAVEEAMGLGLDSLVLCTPRLAPELDQALAELRRTGVIQTWPGPADQDDSRGPDPTG